MTQDITEKLRDYQAVKDALRLSMKAGGEGGKKLFDNYLELRNAYELKYHERFVLNKQPR